MDSTGDSLENSVVQGLCVLLNVCVFPSIFVHALFFMFYVMFAVCAFCAWFPDSLIVFVCFCFFCEHVLVVSCFYLSICSVFVCRIEKWMAKGFKYIWDPPPPFQLYTYMVYLEISLFLSTYPCVSFSLSLSLSLKSSIPPSLYQSISLTIYLFTSKSLPSIYGSIYSISRSIYHILVQISIMI